MQILGASFAFILMVGILFIPVIYLLSGVLIIGLVGILIHEGINRFNNKELDNEIR